MRCSRSCTILAAGVAIAAVVLAGRFRQAGADGEPTADTGYPPPIPAGTARATVSFTGPSRRGQRLWGKPGDRDAAAAAYLELLAQLRGKWARMARPGTNADRQREAQRRKLRDKSVRGRARLLEDHRRVHGEASRYLRNFHLGGQAGKRSPPAERDPRFRVEILYPRLGALAARLRAHTLPFENDLLKKDPEELAGLARSDMGIGESFESAYGPPAKGRQAATPPAAVDPVRADLEGDLLPVLGGDARVVGRVARALRRWRERDTAERVNVLHTETVQLSAPGGGAEPARRDFRFQRLMVDRRLNVSIHPGRSWVDDRAQIRALWRRYRGNPLLKVREFFHNLASPYEQNPIQLPGDRRSGK